MTPLESNLLRLLGLGYLGSLAQLSVYLFFYGVFVVLFSASVVIFVSVVSFVNLLFLNKTGSPKLDRRKGFSSRATAAMFIATIVNFLLSSLNAGTQVALFIVFIRKALILDIDYPLPEKRILVDNALRNLDVVYFWAVSPPIFLSNLIVIWRTWALFRDQQWVIFLPFILWIGAVGLSGGGLIWLSSDLDGVNSNLCNSLTTAVLALSMAASAVATMMSSYKLWSCHTFIVNTLGLRGRKSPVQTVLILLIESDVVYLVFQIAYLVSNAVPTAPGNLVGYYFFCAVYLSLCPLYPTVVMILAETQRSRSLVASDPIEARLTNLLGHLSIAVEPDYLHRGG